MALNHWLKSVSVAALAGLLFVACGPAETEDSNAAEGVTQGVVAGVVEGVGTATAEQIAAYPLENCAVSGEPLGSMGEPIDYFANGTLVRLCCENCIETLESDPDTYVTKVLVAKADADETQE